MTFRFSDNLALAQNMPVTVSNVPFGMREVSYEERPIHVLYGLLSSLGN